MPTRMQCSCTATNDAEGYQFTGLEFPGAAYLNKAAETAKKNPQLLFYKMQSNAYKYSWALIPISVPFVWLLFFWRRRFKMFDHAVFVTYSLTFMMLLGLHDVFSWAAPAWWEGAASMAALAAWRMWGGVSKSGSPMKRSRGI